MSLSTSMNWRPMASEDLVDVNAIADVVHLEFPEDEAVFAERLRLYPAGCFVLKSNSDIVGYIISHPWIFGDPPELNFLLKNLPVRSTTYYLHDIALLPKARGKGITTAIIERLSEHARSHGFTNLSLVAVNNSSNYWGHHRFAVVHDLKLQAKLDSYESTARYMSRQLS